MHISVKSEKIQPVRAISETAEMMAQAAAALLASLSDDERRKAVFQVESAERWSWTYLPAERPGIALRDLAKHQQRLALALLASGLSRRANIQALGIMSLEKILRESEKSDEYDPDRFFLAIFGSPTGSAPWGWRFEGHHVSVNFLIAENSEIAYTPNFLGANPARVLTGPLKGFRVLPAEEDQARRLLLALDPLRRSIALIDDNAPADILTKWKPRIKLDAPVGISALRMNEEQVKLLLRLLYVYAARLPDDLSETSLERIDKDGIGNIHFAWAGSEEAGKPHYYRIHGPSFLIEYDNTQNDANHIHTVWRDFYNDWGDDILRAHYEGSHQG